MTSSPSCSITGLPSGSQASSATPSSAAGIRPTYTGCSGLAPTSAEQTSVPPEIELSWAVALTCSLVQIQAWSGSVEPVCRMPRIRDRSRLSLGEDPALLPASR